MIDQASIERILSSYFDSFQLVKGKDWYIAATEPELVLRVPREHAAPVANMLYNTYSLVSRRNVTLRFKEAGA